MRFVRSVCSAVDGRRESRFVAKPAIASFCLTLLVGCGNASEPTPGEPAPANGTNGVATDPAATVTSPATNNPSLPTDAPATGSDLGATQNPSATPPASQTPTPMVPTGAATPPTDPATDPNGVGGSTAGTDGAIAGSGGASAPPLGTASCPPNALLCEDFDDGAFQGWTSVLTSGSLEIDSRQAFSGTNALSINVPANQRGGFLQQTGAPLFPLQNNQMWGRVMVYFDSLSPGHTDFVRGAPANTNPPWYNVAEQTGDVLLNYYNGADFDCWARPAGGKTLELGAWMCFEWNFDGNADTMQFYIDGALEREVSATGDGCLSGQASLWDAPEFGSLQIGQYIAEIGSTEAQMWLDDIAVGTESRIGCPPAP